MCSVQGDVFKLFYLSDQQFKTLKCEIYNNIKHRKAANLHIYEAR